MKSEILNKLLRPKTPDTRQKTGAEVLNLRQCSGQVSNEERRSCRIDFILEHLIKKKSFFLSFPRKRESRNVE